MRRIQILWEQLEDTEESVSGKNLLKDYESGVDVIEGNQRVSTTTTMFY
jgi:hypothetical protein